MYNMLIRPTDEELADFGEPDFVIYNAGEHHQHLSVLDRLCNIGDYFVVRQSAGFHWLYSAV
jgi:ATP-dependent phosphoenolpyruvate carboxykinase